MHFIEGKWFGQIIISSSVQTQNAIGHIVALGHDDDGGLVFGLTKIAAKIQSVFAWQVEVEEKEVVILSGGEIFSIFGCGAMFNNEVLAFQSFNEIASQDDVIFDDENFGHDFGKKILVLF